MRKVNTVSLRLGETDSMASTILRNISLDRVSEITSLPTDQIPVPVALVALDGRVASANPAFASFFGWDSVTEPSISARSFGDSLDTTWPDRYLQLARDGVMNPQPVHHRFQRLDGGSVMANLRTWPARAADGQIVGMVAMFSGSGATAPDQYRLLWEAFEDQHELMVEWALDGTVLFSNRSCREFFGWDENVVGHHLDEIYEWTPPQSRTFVVERILSEASVKREQRVYASGRVVEWADTAVRDELGNVVSIFSMGQDITDRVRVEEALRLSERRNRVMVSNFQDAVLMLDGSARLIEASAQLPGLGYGGSAGFMGERLSELVHPDDRATVGVVYSTLAAEPGSQTGWFEFRALRADGDYAWLEVSGNNLLDDPEVGAVVLTIRNIDARKRLEIELEARRHQAQEELRERLALVAQVGHELRNPLQGLAAFSDHLLSRRVPREIADDVEAISRLAAVMRRVVDDLLDASQLELGTLSVRSDVVDIVPIIDDAVFMARQLTQPGVEVSGSDVPSNLRYVVGDTDRIRQALTNLLSNACKHTASGTVTVDAAAADSMVRLNVRDTGSGISSDDVARLFRPFERGRQDHESDMPGVGLGLAIVTGIAAAMGGSTGAAPRAEGGSVFWIDIPLSADGAPVTQIAAPRREVPRRHVLIVDDEPLNRLAAKFLLADLGAEVVTAVSGEQALRMLEDQRFDTVFADVQLPGISGLEMTRQLRARVGRQPVVAIMTGDVSDASRSAAIAAGADVFVPKPSTVDDLVSVLRREPRG